MNPRHAEPTAWDFKLGRMSPSFVLIVLKDGTQFRGLLGARSFISSDPKERDLFLEKVFEVGDGEADWQPTEKSLLIGAGEIRSIEFFREDAQ
jgi:hypothetical protein